MRFEQSTSFSTSTIWLLHRSIHYYIGVGDDNFTFRPPNGRFSPSQDVSKVFGKILRIDPLGNNSANGQYGIPADNPFVGADGAAEEVYAIGLRNPWRITVDPKDGVFHAADVWELSAEEVYVIVSGRDLSARDLAAAFREASHVRESVPVPEPSSCMLVVAGMISLANWRMRRKRSSTC